MNQPSQPNYSAFLGDSRVASGQPLEVASRVKSLLDAGERGTILIFDDRTGRQIDFNFSGELEDVLGRLEPAVETGVESPPKSRGRGRPKLGVVAREVTLLPRHWEWLNSQPGGASVALRKLVEEARKGNDWRDRMRQAREAAYNFMSAMAGNRPGFEEACRALFAGEAQIFAGRIEDWPPDIRAHTQKLAQPAFSNPRSRQEREL